jgi:hypothetical protein
VVGSHSSSHKKQKAGNSYKKNRKALVELETDSCEPQQPAGVRIDAQARLTRPGRRIKTSAVLHDHPVLSAFAGLPSKENGVDIEGLAAKDGAPYLGFRGPVLRENFVPIARVDLPATTSPSCSAWPGGRGARHGRHDRRIHPGGPERRSDWSFDLYHWDGRDMVTGTTGRRAEPCGICARSRMIPTATPRDWRSCLRRLRRRDPGLRQQCAVDGAAASRCNDEA